MCVARYFKPIGILWGTGRGKGGNSEGELSGGVLEWLPEMGVRVNRFDPK